MRLLRKILIGLAVLLALVPYAGIFVTATVAALLRCEVNEIAPQPCVVFGSDLGGFLNGMLLTGGLGQITIPILMVVLVLWALVEVYLYRRRRRRARKLERRAARAHKRAVAAASHGQTA